VDYIVKPFSIEELLARVRVVLRTRQASARATEQEPVFQSGELTVDFAQRIVSVSGQPVSLSKTEFKLLRVLAQHAGMVLSHEVLLERVWGAAYSQEIEFVWVYIRRLRRKIEPDPANPCYILTVPGVGYRLARL
ncbi:MAG: winged helix-turn-helix domain-containing protein, partial [Ktedonobacterales bacterium]